jgi:hypothetical protein
MLCGRVVVAIWNGITGEGRAGFYHWHLTEHMAERVDIAGFAHGRCYRAFATVTHPEFFTLSEVDSFEVLTAKDYAERLNAPMTWTNEATAGKGGCSQCHTSSAHDDLR